MTSMLVSVLLLCAVTSLNIHPVQGRRHRLYGVSLTPQPQEEGGSVEWREWDNHTVTCCTDKRWRHLYLFKISKDGCTTIQQGVSTDCPLCIHHNVTAVTEADAGRYICVVSITQSSFISQVPDVDECLSSPCRNGGQCVDEDKSYFCSCPRGYQGVNCQLKECDYTRECPGEDRVCYDTTCLCDIDLYYSEDTDHCIPSCPTSALRRAFTVYPHSYINGYAIQSFTNVSQRFCEQTCVRDPECRSFEFYPPGGGCQLQHITFQDVPTDAQTFGINTAWDYYGRHCA